MKLRGNEIRMQAVVTFEYITDPDFFVDTLDDTDPFSIAREEQLFLESDPLEFLSTVSANVTSVEVTPLEG